MSAPLHEAVQQLSWLLGTWESETAKGFFPTIKPFEYKETLEFTHVGQPMLNFKFSSFTPDGQPKHRDSGFMRVNAGTNHVAFLAAQNVGIVEIEEGDVNGTELQLESTGIMHATFASLPQTTKYLSPSFAMNSGVPDIYEAKKGISAKIARTFKLIDESTLEQTVSMATTTTPELKPHLSVRYKKA